MEKINQIINKIVMLLHKNNIILEEDSDIYSYGLEILMSNIILLITIMLVGILSHRVQYTLLFLIIFGGSRRVMGGYHTDKRWKCFLLTHVLHGIILGLTVLDCTYLMNELVFICIIFAVSIVYIAAPVENENNPKTPEEMAKNRLLSRLMINILAIVALAGFYGGEYYKLICFIITMIMTIVGILLLIPYIKEW